MLNKDKVYRYTYKNIEYTIHLTDIEVGRVCVKTAGREAGEKCAIVEIIDEFRKALAGEDGRYIDTMAFRKK